MHVDNEYSYNIHMYSYVNVHFSLASTRITDSIFFYFPTINSPQKYLNVEDPRVGMTVREYKFESKQLFKKKSKCLSSYLKFQNWVTETGEFLELNVQPCQMNQQVCSFERTYLKRLGEEQLRKTPDIKGCLHMHEHMSAHTPHPTYMHTNT